MPFIGPGNCSPVDASEASYSASFLFIYRCDLRFASREEQALIEVGLAPIVPSSSCQSSLRDCLSLFSTRMRLEGGRSLILRPTSSQGLQCSNPIFTTDQHVVSLSNRCSNAETIPGTWVLSCHPVGTRATSLACAYLPNQQPLH